MKSIISSYIRKILFRIKQRPWHKIVRTLYGTRLYPFIYRSYWHSLFFKKKASTNLTCYYTACPHPTAGIGHQIANWNAGYWYAKQFGLKFVHIPFSVKKWDYILGFGENEMAIKDLLKKNRYKKRKLPLFTNDVEMNVNKKIITSYSGQNVIFIAEQDQPYYDQIGIIENIKSKFNKAKSRKYDKLIYTEENYNIAMHIRRGDIMLDGLDAKSVYKMRFQNNNYYVNILENVISNNQLNKPIYVYIFSQGKEDDFSEFINFDNVKFCLNMDQYSSFIHLVNADLLITSKSGFSYMPALLSDGIKISPKDFWHSYPIKDDWIIADHEGDFDNHKLQTAILKKNN